MAGRQNSKQDANGCFSIIGIDSSETTRAIKCDEDGNLLVTVNDVILVSPNLTSYRLKISDAGVLSTELVS